jgi:hypothetical protein
MPAAQCRDAGIYGAGVFIIAVHGFKLAARLRMAPVYGAGIFIIAQLLVWCVHTSGQRVTSIHRARHAVVTIYRIIQAANPGIAGVYRAGVIIIA